MCLEQYCGKQKHATRTVAATSSVCFRALMSRICGCWRRDARAPVLQDTQGMSALVLMLSADTTDLGTFDANNILDAGQEKRGNVWEAEERDVVNQRPAFNTRRAM